MNKSLRDRNNNDDSIEKHPYSGIQYFFWLLAGCEISVLKECPTDYNRQAGIGFTIFMTTLFAAFAGGYAGYYFGKSLLAGLCFGILWALLVFSIDRTMVVTLKKNPSVLKQNFWIPFLGRGVLSLLIAFIISIPLELLIFKSQIDIQKRFDAPSQLSELEELYKQTGGYYQDSTERARADKAVQLALESSNDCMRDGQYLTYMSEYEPLEVAADKASRIASNYNSNYNTKLSNAANTSDFELRQYRYKEASTYLNSKEYQNAQSESKRLSKEKSVLFDKKTARCKEFIIEQMKIAADQQKVSEGLGINMDSIKIIADRQKDTLRQLLTENFIRDYIALENAAVRKKITTSEIDIFDRNGKITGTKKTIHTEFANSGLLFFIWLIRILFFLIELLPTVAKIATPVGAYDLAIWQREQDFRRELELRSSLLIDHRLRMKELSSQEEQRLLNEQHQIEGKLRKDIMEEIAKAQDEVARQKIQEYRDKNLNGNLPV